MALRAQRILIRLAVGTALGAAILAAVLAPTSALPAVALGQIWLFRLEVCLLAFYGCLLLITPAFAGLIRGRLPVEISIRGAKFAEEADRSGRLIEAKLDGLELATDALAEGLTVAHAEVKQLREVAVGDNTQRRVDSNS